MVSVKEICQDVKLFFTDDPKSLGPFFFWFGMLLLIGFIGFYHYPITTWQLWVVLLIMTSPWVPTIHNAARSIKERESEISSQKRH